MISCRDRRRQALLSPREEAELAAGAFLHYIRPFESVYVMPQHAHPATCACTNGKETTNMVARSGRVNNAK